MRVISFFLIAFFLVSTVFVSCGKENNTVAPATGGPGGKPTEEEPPPMPWENVTFMNLPERDMPLVDKNTRKLEFSDGLNVEALFSDDRWVCGRGFAGFNPKGG